MNQLDTPPSLYTLKETSSWEETYKYEPPLNVEIETDARCNRTCDYCPVAHNKKRKGQMSLEFFSTIIDQLHEIGFNGYLGFHFYNEPLLDNRLDLLVSIARKKLKNSVLYVITNGDLLTEEKVISLLDAGLNYIRVSLHDEKIEETIKNLLISLDTKYSSKIKVFNYYKGERVMTTRAGTIKIDKEKFDIVSVKGGCVWATRMVINYDGIVPLCCDDFHANFAHGDLKKQTIKEIWQNSVQKREKIFKGNYELPACIKCLEHSK